MYKTIIMPVDVFEMELSDKAVRHAEFLAQQAFQCALFDLAHCDGTYDHGDRLVAGVAAYACDDRHQGCERDELRDRILEQANHA